VTELVSPVAKYCVRRLERKLLTRDRTRAAVKHPSSVHLIHSRNSTHGVPFGVARPLDERGEITLSYDNERFERLKAARAALAAAWPVEAARDNGGFPGERGAIEILECLEKPKQRSPPGPRRRRTSRASQTNARYRGSRTTAADRRAR